MDEVSMKFFDVIVIGGGAAGLTVGIYAPRAGLKTLILEKGLIGGLTATADIIENYPGFPKGIGGNDLMEKMKLQSQRFGAEIIQSEVKYIKKSGSTFLVNTDKMKYTARALIIAAGTVPKKLNIAGEDELRGRGVSYCATCDGPLFRDRTIAIIGCGNSGVQEGLFLFKFVKSIVFIEYLPYMTADKVLQDRLLNEVRANIMLNHKLISINGKERVSSITIQNRENKQEKTIDVDGVFIYAGIEPYTRFLKGLVDLDDKGFIVTNEKLETSVPGIFAVGDVRSKKIRQVITACAEGAEAALYAYHYIESLQ